MVKETTVPGEPMQMSQEELQANKQKTVTEKLKIIDDLNKMNVPVSATVFSHGQPWSIRNKAFWKELQGRDESIIKFMQQYLTDPAR